MNVGAIILDKVVFTLHDDESPLAAWATDVASMFDRKKLMGSSLRGVLEQLTTTPP